MAQKSEIQYIRIYTDGSSARKLEPKPAKKMIRKPRPKPEPKKQTVLHVDPIALGGIVVAAVMMVLMAVGILRLQAAQAYQAEMEQYVASLSEENVRLQAEYESGYDLDAVEQMARALGMVPVEQVEQIPMTVTVPPIPEEPTLWEKICGFFTELFA